MLIVGCDFHTRFQQIAILDPATGEVIERRLEHESGEAREFYGSLLGPACVEVDATINAALPSFGIEKGVRRRNHGLWLKFEYMV